MEGQNINANPMYIQLPAGANPISIQQPAGSNSMSIQLPAGANPMYIQPLTGANAMNTQPLTGANAYVQPLAGASPNYIQLPAGANPISIHQPAGSNPMYIQLPAGANPIQPLTGANAMYIQPPAAANPMYVQPLAGSNPNYIQPLAGANAMYIQSQGRASAMYIQPQAGANPMYIQLTSGPNPMYIQPPVGANSSRYIQLPAGANAMYIQPPPEANPMYIQLPGVTNVMPVIQPSAGAKSQCSGCRNTVCCNNKSPPCVNIHGTMRICPSHPLVNTKTPPGDLVDTMEHKCHPGCTLKLAFYAANVKNEFTCVACGGDIKDSSVYGCLTCSLKLHVKCAFLPEALSNEEHDGPMTLYYSAESACGPEKSLICGICGQTTPKNQWVYYCQKCGYGTDVSCTLVKEHLKEDLQSYKDAFKPYENESRPGCKVLNNGNGCRNGISDGVTVS